MVSRSQLQLLTSLGVNGSQGEPDAYAANHEVTKLVSCSYAPICLEGIHRQDAPVNK